MDMSYFGQMASLVMVPTITFNLLGCGSGLPSQKADSTDQPSTTAPRQFEVIYNFNSGTDPFSPMGSILISGSTLYGTTFDGGDNDEGAIYKVNTDGSGFTVLHSFDAATGRDPEGGLVIDGSTLYGTTGSGGADDSGVIFKINTDGTGYTVLHSLTGATQGNNSKSKLLLIGSTLYGTTYSSGAGNAGSIFKIATDGTGFQVLHSFAQATASNGTYSIQSPLINIGSTLFGVTVYGGAHGNGTAYKINTDGTGFSLLHSFNNTDGNSPLGGLVAIGTTLYGVTESGGTHGHGVIFKVNADGTGFGLVHEFNEDDGSFLGSGLVANGNTLYGIALEGGDNGIGTAFKVNADSSGFAVLHHFENAKGAGPSNIIYSGGHLYGTTYEGGMNGRGVVFIMR